MKEFCSIPKAMAERILRRSPSTGGECNETNSDNDINNYYDTNQPLGNLKRISSLHKTKRSLLATNVEKRKNINNNNNNKNVRRQRTPNQNHRQRRQRSRRVSGAKDAIFPPKVKLMMMNRPTTKSTTATNSTTSAIADSRPNLDNLVNISAKAATSKEYIKSFLSLLRNTPEISWDASGNLLTPFRNYNIINILKTLSNVGDKKKGLEEKDVPFIRMILHRANLDPSFIRNSKAKKQLMGGAKLLPLAQAQKMRWERYRL